MNKGVLRDNEDGRPNSSWSGPGGMSRPLPEASSPLITVPNGKGLSLNDGVHGLHAEGPRLLFQPLQKGGKPLSLKLCTATPCRQY